MIAKYFKSKTRSFESVQPIDIIGTGYVMLKSGYTTVGLELEWPGIFFMTEEEIQTLVLDKFKYYTSKLPSGTCVHFQNVYDQSEVELDYHPDDYLEKTSKKMMESKIQSLHRSFFFISFPSSYSTGDFVVYKDDSFKRIDSRKGAAKLKEVNINEKLNIIFQFHKELNSDGVISSIFFDEKKFREYSKSYVTATFFKEPRWGNIRDNDTSLSLGSKHISFMSLQDNPDINVLSMDYPDHTTDFTKKTSKEGGYNLPASFINPICLGLACPHITNLSFIIHDNKSFAKKLENHIRDLRGIGATFDSNETKYAFIKGFIKEIETDPTERFVTYSLNVMLIGKSQKELDKHRDLAARAFKRLNMSCVDENFTNMDLFVGNMCGNGYEIPRIHLGQLGMVTKLFPFESNGLFSTKGLLVNTITGRPTFMDLLSKTAQFGSRIVKKTNLNGLLFGKTGSGKSNLLGYLIRYFWNLGSHIVLLDKGNSFGRLTRFFGGKLYKYEETKPLAFNPFQIGKDQSGKYLYSPDELSFLMPLMIASIYESFDEMKLSTITDVLTDTILRDYYDAVNEGKIEKVKFNTFYEFIKEFQLRAKNSDNEEYKRIVKVFPFEEVLTAFLKFYKGGIYEELYNADENFDIENDRFIVFELDKIQENPFLFRIITICISKIVDQKFKSPKLEGISKFFFIDEGTFILKDYMKEVIAGLFQTARKHYAGIWFTDQTFDKLHESGVANRIAGNSDTIILLEQKWTTVNKAFIKDYLSFTDMSIRKVQAIDNSGNWREGVLKINDFITNFRVVQSPEYYMTLNTDNEGKMAEINNRIIEYFEATNNIEYAIEQVKEESDV